MDSNIFTSSGMDQDGIELLQNYIDRTGDVQSAAFIIIHSINHFDPESRPGLWVSEYRTYLNNLELWTERALFDVLKTNLSGNRSQKKPNQQIYVSCNFCMKSISSYVQAPGRPRNPYAKYGSSATHKSKVSLIIFFL